MYINSSTCSDSVDIVTDCTIYFATAPVMIIFWIYMYPTRIDSSFF